MEKILKFIPLILVCALAVALCASEDGTFDLVINNKSSDTVIVTFIAPSEIATTAQELVESGEATHMQIDPRQVDIIRVHGFESKIGDQAFDFSVHDLLKQQYGSQHLMLTVENPAIAGSSWNIKMEWKREE